MKKGIMFDLDGTLWDSCQAVAEAWTRQLRKEGYDCTLTESDMRSVMGLSMDILADRLLPFVEAGKRQEVAHHCEVYENEWLADHAGRLYEGVREVLKTLRDQGWHLSIVSNCQTGYIEAFMASSQLEECFDDFESYGNTLLPKEENMKLVAGRNNLDLCWYVGDTTMDAQAALRAEIPFVYASYGFGQDCFEPAVSSFWQLPELLGQLFSQRQKL